MAKAVSTKRLLFLAAGPRERAPLKLEDEQREIQKALLSSGIEMTSLMATNTRDLRSALLARRPTMVHFCGHGTREGVVLGQGSDTVSVRDLADILSLFSDHHDLEFVFLNCCHSREQALNISAAVPFCIGWEAAAEDRYAVELASGFYQALARGEPYPFCFSFALESAKLEGWSATNPPELIKGPGLSEHRNEKSLDPETGEGMAKKPNGSRNEGIQISGGAIHVGGSMAVGRHAQASHVVHAEKRRRQQVREVMSELSSTLEVELADQGQAALPAVELDQLRQAVDRKDPETTQVEMAMRGLLDRLVDMESLITQSTKILKLLKKLAGLSGVAVGFLG